ncbi:MAG TPA: MarR family transcriptional regulator [Candidatus Xenobia bacterium]|jgi:DNA-binding MarR family transcriptional regulator
MADHDVAELPLWVQISHAAGRIEQQLEDALAGSGLSLSKLAVLRQLTQSDEPLPLTQLARRLSCVKSNVTQLVDRLEAEGLVVREDDPDDRRSVRARITDSGRTRCEVGCDALHAREREIFAAINEAEGRMLGDVLKRLG